MSEEDARLRAEVVSARQQVESESAEKAAALHMRSALDAEYKGVRVLPGVFYALETNKQLQDEMRGRIRCEEGVKLAERSSVSGHFKI